MSRSFGGTRLTTLPPMLTSPPVISSSPAIMRNSVDLPQPDGPTRTQNSPSAISTSTPRMTCVEPKFLRTALMLTAAIFLPSHPRNGTNERSRSAAPRAGYHHVVGPPGLHPTDDVLRRLPPQLHFRLDAEKCSVRRQDHLRMMQQSAISGDRLDRQDIQRGAGKYSTIECAKQMVDIDDCAPRSVDQKRAAPHSA